MVIDKLGILRFIKNDINSDDKIYCNEKELVLRIECFNDNTLIFKRKRNKKSNYPYVIEVIEEKIKDKKKENIKILKTKQISKFYSLIPFTD